MMDESGGSSMWMNHGGLTNLAAAVLKFTAKASYKPSKYPQNTIFVGLGMAHFEDLIEELEWASLPHLARRLEQRRDDLRAIAAELDEGCIEWLAIEGQPDENDLSYYRSRVQDLCRAGEDLAQYLLQLEQNISQDKLADAVHLPAGEEAAPLAPTTLGEQGNQSLPPNIFRRYGDGWQIRFNGGEGVVFSDLKGFRILAKLLESPDPQRPIPSIDLAGGDSSLVAGTYADQPQLDDQARREYQQQLAEYARDIKEAYKQGDEPKAESLEGEREEVLEMLRDAAGLQGRSRTLGPPPQSAKYRLAVRRAIDRALKRIKESQPPLSGLAPHLRNSIRTEGDAYAYRPSPEIDWQLK